MLFVIGIYYHVLIEIGRYDGGMRRIGDKAVVGVDACLKTVFQRGIGGLNSL